MFLSGVRLLVDRYPNRSVYPFNLKILRNTPELAFEGPVTFFIGDNGAGKSTLLEALARRCGLHLWQTDQRTRFEYNPLEKALHHFLVPRWIDEPVPGAFFSGEKFENFAKLLDEWAYDDPGQLAYFGGSSLMTQSHGQSLMAYFRSRYQIKGLYLMDEPETALSPRSQIELVRMLNEFSKMGHAQFVIASHSPILLACPGAVILEFGAGPIQKVAYEDTEHYRMTKAFFDDPGRFFED